MTVEKLYKLIKNKGIPPDEFLKELWSFSTGHNRQARVYRPGDLILYRTRRFKEKAGPDYITDLSYPPVEKCKINRANVEGDQVFYASAGFPTTLRESRVLQGEYIIASKWKNTKDVLLQPVGLEVVQDGIEKLYHDIFTDPDDAIYPYSSQIAKHLMTGDPGFGLLYPSIINSNKSHNVALSKSQVDQCMEFINASQYEVKEIIDDTQYSIEEIDFATKLENGRLGWKGRKKQWDVPPHSQSKAISNGWDWELSLEDGTPLEPY